jgi:thiamine biosynthesis lipoprotein
MVRALDIVGRLSRGLEGRSVEVFMPWMPLLGLMLVLTGCTRAREQRFEFTQVVMGVAARVELYAPDEAEARAAAGAAFGRMVELDAVMSDYRLDSELMRLCDRAGGPPVAVSDDLLRVLARAKEVSEASDGAFDVTVGPLVALWREARRSGRLPDAGKLASAREKVGYRKVEVNARGRTVRLATGGLRLDLGGIGKCFAADEAVKLLRERGRGRCLVALAGDIVTGDPPPEKRGWTVAVVKPDGSTENMTLSNRAVSSSGDTEQFIEIGGRRYSHIVDPATGLGVTSRIGATVTAPDGATADALATAVCILGPERGRAVVERFPGAEVRVLGESPD